MIHLLLFGLVAGYGDPTPAAQAEHAALFGAPEMLMVDHQPLNRAAQQMYPSPAIFDVDGDGRNELVVGDIFGTLNVYENMSDGSDPRWGPHHALESVEGEAIKVSNW